MVEKFVRQKSNFMRNLRPDVRNRGSKTNIMVSRSVVGVLWSLKSHESAGSSSDGNLPTLWRLPSWT